MKATCILLVTKPEVKIKFLSQVLEPGLLNPVFPPNEMQQGILLWLSGVTGETALSEVLRYYQKELWRERNLLICGIISL